jgi:succinate dehydrogenase / fumarate reductase flavoprotein subunit
MGGVWVRPEDHGTGAEGLYAIGESPSGLHMGEPENVRALQRALRDTMAERAGVVRDEAGLRQVLSKLDDIEKRMADVGVHPAWPATSTSRCG